MAAVVVLLRKGTLDELRHFHNLSVGSFHIVSIAVGCGPSPCVVRVFLLFEVGLPLGSLRHCARSGGWAMLIALKPGRAPRRGNLTVRKHGPSNTCLSLPPTSRCSCSGNSRFAQADCSLVTRRQVCPAPRVGAQGTPPLTGHVPALAATVAMTNS